MPASGELAGHAITQRRYPRCSRTRLRDMSNANWILERIGSNDKPIERYRIAGLPCIIGRSADCGLRLPLDRISRRHARLDRDDEGLLLADLGSTNGTFVDGRRVSDEATRLSPGRTVHLAEHEFRIVDGDEPVHESPAAATDRSADGHKTVVGFTGGPAGFPVLAPAFYELLNGAMLECGQRAILDSRGRTHGHEIRPLPKHPKLPGDIEAVFDLADELDEARPLAELCCAKAIRAAARDDSLDAVLLPARITGALDTPGPWLLDAMRRESGLAPARFIAALLLRDPELDRRIDGLVDSGIVCCIEASHPSAADIERLGDRVGYLRLRIDPSRPAPSDAVAAARAAGIACIADDAIAPMDLDALGRLGIELYLDPHP